MFYLKSIYFYFLASKINITKKIKKIYFKTDFYYKSLESKVPKQLYFNPNPFLLSSLTTHKNFSFKISNIDEDIFWNKKPIKKEEENLHNFLWLNLIDRKNDSLTIQKIINVWIYKNSKYKNIIWDNSVICKRLISWILNTDIILNNTNNIFKNDLFNSIIIQINHLKKNIKFENNYSKKIEIVSAILLSGLVFKDYSENYEIGIKELKKIIDNTFDKNGFPVSRNPGDLIKYSKYLIVIKECINDAQQFIPDYLEEIINKNLKCIGNIITPRKELPLFNGAIENNLEKYLSYLKSLKYKISKSDDIIGQIQIIKSKKSYLYFDVGEPPKKNESDNYQSGPLSFEYFLDNEKIISNCGFGRNISNKAKLLSRLTSAQSTLVINDHSAVKFERNAMINKAFGNSIKNNFKILNFNYVNNDNLFITSASHNAYEKKFGYIVKRELKINKNNDVLSGCDSLIKTKQNSKINFNIRFHLYPGISAVKTMSGNAVLIQINKNKSLIFEANSQNISLEKSIFLGGNKIINNLCITISNNLYDKNMDINWEIKRHS